VLSEEIRVYPNDGLFELPPIPYVDYLVVRVLYQPTTTKHKINFSNNVINKLNTIEVSKS